jgi:tetratricopeptide (TPR) repeat protein
VVVALNKIGDTRALQHDPAGALNNYDEALAISRGLATADPSSAQALGDLTFCLGRIGDTSLVAGDAAGAQKAYAEALALLRDFAKAHPAIASPAAHGAAGLMAKLVGVPGSGVSWAQVVSYVEAMKAQGLFQGDDEKWLALYRQKAAGPPASGAAPAGAAPTGTTQTRTAQTGTTQPGTTQPGATETGTAK